ncbi:serine C-palmitoyltransferase [Aureococcus anophagefferens]|nr:serine C-palmitoyltransferase [Aureococcus anophagefferens]
MPFASADRVCVDAGVQSLAARDAPPPPGTDMRMVPEEVMDRPPTDNEAEMSYFTEFTTYFAYMLLIVVGHFRDFWGRASGRTRWKTLLPSGAGRAKLAPLFKSSPSAWITVQSRATDPATKELEKTGKTQRCLNLGSYNYLGFADDWMATCGPPVLRTVDDWPISCGSSRSDLGTTALHRTLEERVAAFVGKEDAVVFNMGYGTNSTTVPGAVGKGDLVVSDELNHASIVNGCRASGALIRSFKHNDAEALEAVLREAVSMGAPRTRRPWKKILVMVEGIYSMEGEICNLKAIAAVAKRYKAYLYLDEAHSIGALGANGRGACEHCGVDPKDVDILMGTFTKSFGGMGGYVAASKAVVDHLRVACPGILNHDAMSPAVPIIPVLLYNPTKIAAFSRECLKRDLAVVVVGFPATTLVKSRAFCVSAGHTRADLEDGREDQEVAALIKIQYKITPFG